MKLACLLFVALALQGQAPVSVRIEPQNPNLRGPQQFLLLGTFADGSEHDLTDQAAWTVSHPALAQISAGRLEPSGDGKLAISASFQGRAARTQATLAGVRDPRPFQFARDIGGIFTKRGCNGANCHGGVKGRGGFKLSAGALHPRDDFEWTVKGGVYQVLTDEVKGPRTPRINTQNPEDSLLLKKATGTVPHGGGKRFAKESPEYQTLAKWIRGGAPFGPDDGEAAQVTRLDVFPRVVTLTRGAKHRLLVTARLSNGHSEDFTSQAFYLPADRDIAAVDESGVVTSSRLGETSVLIRAAGQAASVTVGVIGDPVEFTAPPAVNFIDELVFAKLRKFRTPPSGLSADSEFLRRVCLDLTGTLPPPGRVREFLASKAPDKRAKLVEALMASPEFVDFWTFRFDDVFRVAVFSNGITPKWSQMYGEWVKESIATNKPYDQMARERLTAQGYDGPTRHYLPYNVIGPPAESMAEEVRVFFGRRLDCAQCHNHPYEAWSQDQFWGMAAFFGRVFKMGDTGTEYVIFDHPLNEEMGNADVNGSVKLLHPRTKREVRPALLDGKVVQASDRENPRRALAEWMVRHPYFSEAAVNRLWSYFFGRGLVDPVDDFRSTNPPSHPELLERLAQEFRSHGHDLRHIMRLIVASRTYQLTARPTPANREDRTNYSHALPRPLEAEVLLDAIGDVTGVAETFSTGVSDTAKASGQAPIGTRAITLREPDLFYSRFLELYGRPNRLTVPERSAKANLGQALNMLAGPVYNEKLTAPEGRLQRLLKSGAGDDAMIEEFYLAALTRHPLPAETEAVKRAIAGRPTREEAWKDFVWAILCSREFAENH